MAKLYYTKEHEWLRVDGDIATIGITCYAQDKLGDLVFVDLPEIGAELQAEQAVAVVESVKAASDVYCPINGQVCAINERLQDEPSLVNSSPEDEGWLWQMKIAPEASFADFMDASSYQEFIGKA